MVTKKVLESGSETDEEPEEKDAKQENKKQEVKKEVKLKYFDKYDTIDLFQVTEAAPVAKKAKLAAPTDKPKQGNIMNFFKKK